MFCSLSVLDDFFRFSINSSFWVFLVHPTVVSVLLSASVKRCFVSCMREGEGGGGGGPTILVNVQTPADFWVGWLPLLTEVKTANLLWSAGQSNSTLYCTALQGIGVDCSMLLYVQWTLVKLCSAMNCSEVQCTLLQCSAVQCSAGQFSADQCNTIKYVVAQFSWTRWGRNQFSWLVTI